MDEEILRRFEQIIFGADSPRLLKQFICELRSRYEPKTAKKMLERLLELVPEEAVGIIVDAMEK